MSQVSSRKLQELADEALEEADERQRRHGGPIQEHLFETAYAAAAGHLHGKSGDPDGRGDKDFFF